MINTNNNRLFNKDFRRRIALFCALLMTMNLITNTAAPFVSFADTNSDSDYNVSEDFGESENEDNSENDENQEASGEENSDNSDASGSDENNDDSGNEKSEENQDDAGNGSESSDNADDANDNSGYAGNSSESSDNADDANDNSGYAGNSSASSDNADDANDNSGYAGNGSESSDNVEDGNDGNESDGELEAEENNSITENASEDKTENAISQDGEAVAPENEAAENEIETTETEESTGISAANTEVTVQEPGIITEIAEVTENKVEDAAAAVVETQKEPGPDRYAIEFTEESDNGMTITVKLKDELKDDREVIFDELVISDDDEDDAEDAISKIRYDILNKLFSKNLKTDKDKDTFETSFYRLKVVDEDGKELKNVNLNGVIEITSETGCEIAAAAASTAKNKKSDIKKTGEVDGTYKFSLNTKGELIFGVAYCGKVLETWSRDGASIKLGVPVYDKENDNADKKLVKIADEEKDTDEDTEVPWLIKEGTYRLTDAEEVATASELERTSESEASSDPEESSESESTSESESSTETEAYSESDLPSDSELSSESESASEAESSSEPESASESESSSEPDMFSEPDSSETESGPYSESPYEDETEGIMWFKVSDNLNKKYCVVINEEEIEFGSNDCVRIETKDSFDIFFDTGVRETECSNGVVDIKGLLPVGHHVDYMDETDSVDVGLFDMQENTDDSNDGYIRQEFLDISVLTAFTILDVDESESDSELNADSESELFDEMDSGSVFGTDSEFKSDSELKLEFDSESGSGSSKDKSDSDHSFSIELSDEYTKDTVDIYRLDGESLEKIKISEDDIVYADGLSIGTYVVTSKTKKVRYICSDDGSYEITIAYDESAGIPDDAVPSIKELNERDSEYKDYIDKATEAFESKKSIKNRARVYYIALVDPETNTEYVPDESVEIDISLSGKIRGSSCTDLNVVYFTADEENDMVIPGMSGDTDSDSAEFMAETLPVYAVVRYTRNQILTATDGKSYEITVEYDSNSGIPEDAVLEVTELTETDPNYDEYVSQANEILGKDERELFSARPFDIKLVDPDNGEKYEPDDNVKVSIKLLTGEVKEADELSIVHFKDTRKDRRSRAARKRTDQTENKETISGEIVETEIVDGSVEFETGSFSVFVLVQKIKEQILIAGDGSRYKITVEYDSTCGIPMDAELEVSELKENDSYFTEYVEKTAETLGKESRHFAFAHAFDIKLVDKENGEKYQPTKDVKVSIELLTENLRSGDDVSVVHFKGDVNRETGEDKKNGETYTENLSETEVLNASVNNEGIVEFTTDGFSVYVVTQDALLKRFVFLNGTDPNNDVFAEQVLTDGESLVEPAMPTKAGAVFKHWATVVGSETPATFPQTVSTGDAEGATQAEKQAWLNSNINYYYAVYDTAKTVITYYNQSGLVVEKREMSKPAAGEPVKEENTRDVKYLPIQDKEGAVITFRYWTEDPRGAAHEVGTETSAGSGKYDGVIKITADSPNEIELYPKLDNGHYLYLENNKKAYELGSADFISPETVVDGSTAANVVASLNTRTNHAIPESAGYVFMGWYISSSKSKFENHELTPVFYPNNERTGLLVNTSEYNKLLYLGNLPNNPTLYAHWQKIDTAPYTIMVWQQKLSEDGKSVMTGADGYAYVESKEMPSQSTSNPATAPAAWQGLNNDTNYNSVHGLTGTNQKTGEDNPYWGFALNTSRSEISKDLTGDGKTILNLYYDRVVHTIRFYDTVNEEYYTETTSDNGTQYGLVSGEYVQLTRKSRTIYFLSQDYNGSTAYTGPVYRKNGINYIEEPNPTYPTTYYRYYSGWLSSGYTELYWGRTSEYYWTYNGVEYTGTRYTRQSGNHMGVIYTITAPYGVDISSHYEPDGIVGTNGTTYTGYRWKDLKDVNDDNSGYNQYREVIAKVFLMPNTDINFKADKSNATIKYLYYYAEALPNQTTGLRTHTSTFDNQTRNYALFRYIEVKYNFLTESEDYYTFDGFEKAGSEPAFSSDGTISGETLTNNNSRAYFYYDRKSYDILFRYPDGSIAHVKDTKKYGETMTDYNTDPAYQLSKPGKIFTGWYEDAKCTVKAQLSGTTMPCNNVILYAGFSDVKSRAVLIPNGGDMSGQGVQFHLDADEMVSLADPTRDFIPIEPNGAYTYDDVKGAYNQTDDGTSGQYSAKAGAYLFQGWYEVDMSDAGDPVLVEYKSGKYAYAYGSYQLISAGAEDKYTDNKYTKNGNEYVLDENGTYVFVNYEPTDLTASHIIKKTNGVEQKYDMETAPNRPIVLVALWQRSGGFRVVYNVKDPKLTNLTDADYRGVTAPEDQEEYIDDSHALVKAAISAPKGYTLEYWTDQNWKGDGSEEDKDHIYLPNELIHINEANATLKGSEMVVTLTAHYREFNPIERNMADYTFMTNVKEDLSGFESTYKPYELQKIAVNEELTAPITPAAPEGYAFKGWYYDTEGTRIFNGFGIITNPTYTTLYARFERIFTVNYYLTDTSTLEPTSTVIATQSYRNPGSGLANDKYERLDTRHITHPVDLDHYVVTWVSDWAHKNEEAYQFLYNTANTKRVKDDMNLYAVLRARSYVKFDSCGGSFVEQEEIPFESWPSRPKDPTREGFEFLGWYTSEDGDIEYEFDKRFETLDSDIRTKANNQGTTQAEHDAYYEANKFTGTLYAHWSGDGSATGTLHVIFWAQTADRPEDDSEAAADYNHYQMIYSEDITNVPYNNYTRDSLKTTLAAYVNGDYDIVKTVQKGWNEYSADNTKAGETAAFVNDTLGYKGNNADTVQGWKPQNYINDLNYYYELNGTKSDSGVTVDGDGNSVLNIRFDLKVYFLEFQTANKVEIHYKDIVYPKDGSNKYRIPVWLNRPIAEAWPVDRTCNPTHEGAYCIWDETGKIFDCWKMTVDVASGKSTITLTKTENKEYRTAVTLSDKLLIDSIRKYGNSNVLPVTPASKNSTDYKAVVHYMVRDGDRDHFTERTDLQMVISVPAKPNWVNYSATSNKVDAPPYYMFFESKCDEHLNGTTSIYHPGVKLAYSLLEPIGLSGYVGLDNEHAHAGKLYEEDGVTHEAGWDNDLNESPLYNLISSRKGLAQVIFDKNDPTYTAYFASHTDLYVDEENTYNFYFYYKPLSYELSFYSDSTNQVGSTQNVFCGTDLSTYIDAIGTPEVPSGMSNVYFAGWSTAALQKSEKSAYTGTTMPSQNLTLYAIWKPYQFTVTTIGVAEDGTVFDADENGKATDGSGKTSMTYTASYGQQLRELNIPNPAVDTKLFKGWQNYDSGTSVTGVYKIEQNLKIKPDWTSLDVRKVKYEGAFPDPLPAPFGTINTETNTITETAAPTVPVDDNNYVLGTKLIIHNGGDLYINRVDIDGHYYKAAFAYWEDTEGNRYYPNTTFVFREDTVGLKTINGVKTLVLKAVYSEYRETILLYDKNANDAEFKKADENWVASTENYTKLTDGKVRVLYRDEIRKEFSRPDGDMIPNETFAVGKDRENEHFTVTRTDSYENKYVFAGWGTDPENGTILAQNGDKAYVNTIKDSNGVLRNTLYAIWGICKVYDKRGIEHIFDTIQGAVKFINTNSILINNKTATIHMLIDYNDPENVEIPAGCNVTLTTSRTGLWRYNGTGTATITRAKTGDSLFVNSGTFTLKDIVLDGNKASFTPNTNGGLVSVSAGTLNIQAGAVLQNSKVVGNGGAVYAEGNASVSIAGGTIQNCSSSEFGGGIYVKDTVSLSMSSGTIEHCSVTGNYKCGGAICFDGSGNLNVSGGTIQNCTATGEGGGIAIRKADATVNINGNTKIKNCSAAHGGGMHTFSDATISGSTEFNGCTSTGYGGGLYLYGNGNDNPEQNKTVTISGTVHFTNCKAGWDKDANSGAGQFMQDANNLRKGGAIDVGLGKGSVSLSGSVVIENCEAEYGGGINAEENTHVTIADSVSITGCRATTGGAGVYVQNNAAVTMTGGSITQNRVKAADNSEVADAGAVQFQSGTAKLYLSGDVTITNNPASTGQQKNVILDHNSNEIINVLTDGLGSGAHIGIYVTGGMTETIYKNHGSVHDDFGTRAGSTNSTLNLEKFINDRNGLKGEKCTDNNHEYRIRWASPLCKLTDKDGHLLFKDEDRTRPAIYDSFKDALGTNGEKGSLYDYQGNLYEDHSINLEMLKHYTQESDDRIKYSSSRNITFTTAKSGVINEDLETYRDDFVFINYSSTNTSNTNNNDSMTAIITRGGIKEGFSSDDSMIRLENPEGTTVTIKKLTFDGDNRDYNQNGAIVYIGGTSTLILDNESTLKNGKTSENGGAVYVASNGNLTLKSGGKIDNNTTSKNGGAVYIESNGTFTMQGGEINNNTTSGNGGAVYIDSPGKNDSPGTLIIQGGEINNNTVTGSSGRGAGVYVSEGAILKLDGNVNFGGPGVSEDEDKTIVDTTGNFAESTLTGAKNGGKTYSKARQDIYIAEQTNDDPASLVITKNVPDNITAGSIWVYAESVKHYEKYKPFAVIEPQEHEPQNYELDENVYKAFRNAQVDSVTLCDGDYLSGSKGEKEELIYWSANAVDVYFKKIDGYGNMLKGDELTGTEFTLYTEATCESGKEFKKNNVTMKTNTAEQAVIDEGKFNLVFKEVPDGIYYMKETSIPDRFRVSEKVYVVCVGSNALSKDAQADLLENITPDEITARTVKRETGETVDTIYNYAIFCLDDNNKAKAIPDISTYGVLNEEKGDDKVIMKKTYQDDYSPIKGAEFNILRCDMSPVEEDATSHETGIFWVGKLPYGKYYIKETISPNGSALSSNDYDFVLRYNKDSERFEVYDRDHEPNTDPEP